MASGWQLFLESFWPIVWGGLSGTIPLALASFVIGLVIALAVALARLSKNRVLSAIGRFYAHLETGVALLLGGALFFFGMPLIIQNFGITASQDKRLQALA